MMRVARVLFLVGIWLCLWSDLSVANVVSGVVVAVAIVAVFGQRPGRLIVRPVALVRFTLYFTRKLVESTVVVARAVISPRSAVHTGVVAVPLEGCSDAVVTLIADAISLTPGTLTIEVHQDPPTLFVHALDVRDVARVQADIRTLEVLAIRAFGTAEAIEGLTFDDSVSWRGR